MEMPMSFQRRGVPARVRQVKGFGRRGPAPRHRACERPEEHKGEVEDDGGIPQNHHRGALDRGKAVQVPLPGDSVAARDPGLHRLHELNIRNVAVELGPRIMSKPPAKIRARPRHVAAECAVLASGRRDESPVVPYMDSFKVSRRPQAVPIKQSLLLRQGGCACHFLTWARTLPLR